MPRDPFATLQTRLFARLGGQGAMLRGAPVAALVSDGVAVYGDYNEVTAYRSTAALPSSSTPKGGDPFICGERRFVVDKVLSDDGYETKVLLRELK